MNGFIKYFLRTGLFFFLLFYAERAIFIFFQWEMVRPIPGREILATFAHAFPMDIASVCALLLIPYLFSTVYMFFRHRSIPGAMQAYIIFVIIFTGFINICDVALFKSWGTRINPQAISYLAFPGEAASNALSPQYLLPLIVFILSSLVFIILYSRFFRDVPEPRARPVFKISLSVLLPFILILGIRGGFQTFPLDRSWVYFSRHSVLNQAALNPSWNFFHALTDPVELKKNPYNFFTEQELEKYLRPVYRIADDTTVQVLKTNRPNVLLVMLESFSADVMAPFGGDTGITPRLNALCEEGLLFRKFYTPGFRTEQGLAALVSGFPSQPKTTIIRQFGKFDKLPSLARTLDSAGYHSSYYYGGNLHFAFTGSYLQASGFDRIVGENDFEIRRRTDWGAYDEELFDFFIRDMRNPAQPFFSIIMTSTNHEPFDADVAKIHASIPGDWCGDYINTVHYTDQCIGNFINALKHQPWYEHTLVVIVADHAHSCPGKHEYNTPARHQIPFLLLGGALKEEFRGKTNDRIASQVDFASSLLSLLDLNHSHFPWSKNIFNPTTPDFAFYSFDEGFGWIAREGEVVYDHRLHQALGDSAHDDALLKTGKAYLQVLMDEYKSLGEGGRQ